MFRDRLNIVKIFSFNLSYRFNAILIKFPSMFVDIDKQVLNFIEEANDLGWPIQY